MTVTLGAPPLVVNVTLARGGNFTTTLRSDSNYPSGVGIELLFFSSDDQSDTPIVWTANIVEDQATWNKTVAEVDTVIDKNPSLVRLHYKQEGAVLVWGSGEINVV